MEKEIVNLIKQINSPALPENYDESLHKKLLAASTKELRRKPFIMKSLRINSLFPNFQFPISRFNLPSTIYNLKFAIPAASLAAVVLILCLFVFKTPIFYSKISNLKSQISNLKSQINTNHQSPINNVIPINKDTLIKVNFTAAQDLKDVNFEIHLPDGIAFIGGNGQVYERKSIAWTGNLSKGTTSIPLIVRGTKEGNWQITSIAKKEGYRENKKTVQIPVVRKLRS